MKRLKTRIVEPLVPWHVQETTNLYRLEIKEGAQVIAPEGKFLTLTVDGCGRPLKPGIYQGDVVVSVTRPYHMLPHGLMKFNSIETDLCQAAVVVDNQVVPDQCVPAILQDAPVGDTVTDGLYLASAEDNFNGIVVAGNSEYVVRNSRFDLEGNGCNDWLGVGAALTFIDQTKALVENCQFHYSGVTRCILQVGGDSNVTVRNCRLFNIAPDGEAWVGCFSWAVGFRGHNRIAQLSDAANVRYENCLIHGNGWGLLSIDGTFESVSIYVKDCDMTLSGPRNHGYGAFCIGENHITYDHSKVDVFGYPVLLMGMEGLGRFDVINGTQITGRRFGAMVVSDDNSVFNIFDSSMRTGKSSLCVKGSSTIINVRNSELVPGNGVILQLMDSDESGMDSVDFKIPVGVPDTKDPDRDLSVVRPDLDVTMNLADCTLVGDFFNSTTNIRAIDWSTEGGKGQLHDYVIGMLPPRPEGVIIPGSPPDRHDGDDLKGAKNLGLNLTNTTVVGCISAATQAYREGLHVITCENRDELSNVTQTAAVPVNNGVVVTLDAASVWQITGTCFLTALTLAEGAQLLAADGKELTMKVDGQAIAIAPGSYTGLIELTVA